MGCDAWRSRIPAGPSFHQPRPSRVRNCKLDPNDLLLRSSSTESEQAEVSPSLPCIRVTFHGFHDDCSEGERLDAG